MRPGDTNLPPERTSFVGRERDLEALERLLERGERLVTLVGPGGAGKTRLARRWAARLLGSAAASGGVWFCDLAEARSRDGLLAAVSAALGAPLAGGSTAAAAAAQIAHALSARQPMVLLVDNFEQLVEHAAGTLGAWLAQAPAVTFLVTSRTRLKLEGESVHEVGPLVEPDAVLLFEDRAKKVLPSFAREHDEGALVELIRRLDYSPLAIELAAARVKVLPPRKLLERLAARLDLLRSAHRDGVPRHATLRSALDGSWELLEAWEKQALAQCAVFHGGFSLEAAEAVIEIEGAPVGHLTVDVLEALVEKSLLVRDEAAPRGEARFRLYESVRDYAAEKLGPLDGPAGAAAAARHAAYYLDEAEGGAPASLAPWGAAADRSASREIENLLAIVRRSEGREPRLLARAAASLDAALAARGPADAHREVLDRALAAIEGRGGDAIEPRLRARLYAASADAHRIRGELHAARAEIERALPEARESGAAEVALAELVLANLELDAGRMDAARGAAHRTLESARASADPRLEAIALFALARVHVDIDELEAGRLRCDEALPLARRFGMRLVESQVENLLGVTAARAARLGTAEEHYAASLAIARELGDPYLETMGAVNLADVRARRGDHEGALARYEEVLSLARRMGFRRVHGLVENHIGLLEHDRGRLDEARARHAEGVAIQREIGNRRSEAFGLEVLGLLALEEGRLEEAASALERALGIARAEGLGATLAASAAYLGSVAAARGALDEAARMLAAARQAANAVARPEPTGVADLHEALLWIAEARAREGGAHGAIAGERIDAARRRLRGSAEVAGHSARCRIARRMLERALAAVAPEPSEAAGSAAPPEALAVGADGRWFRRAGGERVDLARRRSLRLLLLRLLRERLDAPGTALSLDALFEAGWPGERITRGPAIRRVYTAIGMLRDLGLREILVRRDDGYLLAPGIPIAVASDDEL